MTRETKVGLVVATSFLSLVGVVVAARMSTPEISGKKTPLADSQTAEKKKKSKESSPVTDPAANDKKGGKVVIATHEEPGKPASEPPALPQHIDVTGALPGPVPSLTPTTPEPKAVGPLPTTEEHEKVITDLKTQTQLAQGPLPLVNDPPGGQPSLLPKDTPKEAQKKIEVKPESTSPAIKPEGPGPLPKPESVNPSPGLNSIPEKSVKPGPGPLANNNALPAPGPLPNNNAPTGPGPEVNKPPVSTGTPVPVSPPSGPAPSGPGNLAPIGAPEHVSSPPISVAMAGGQNNNSLSNVLKYDITTYTVKPDDRSFADISQKVYGSDKYGRALVLFNREQPQVADGIRQEPPQLQPNLPIQYPPKEILEKKYASAIAPAASPANNGSNNSSPVSVGVPRPLEATTPGNPNNVVAPPPGTNVWSEPGGGKNYRVGNNPEPIHEIARNVLGDWTRWSEIYRLNPTVNPQYPIPAGTVLKLP